MQFKFNKDISNWPHLFKWLDLPTGLHEAGLIGTDEIPKPIAKGKTAKVQGKYMSEEERRNIKADIDGLVHYKEHFQAADVGQRDHVVEIENRFTQPMATSIEP